MDSINLLADMIPSDEMLPSPNSTFEDKEDDDFVLHLDESPMEED